MWKAGQIVTIDGEIYRVKKTKNLSIGCIYCDFKNIEAYCSPCDKCIEKKLMQSGCYLKRIRTARDFK